MRRNLKEIRDGTKFTNSHWKALGKDKPIILVDFDHTITTKCLACNDGYSDNKVQRGAKEVLKKLHKDFRIWIFTGNYKYIDKKAELMKRKEDIRRFLIENDIPFDKILQIKPPACFIIDDRAVHHTSWYSTDKEIELRRNCV